MSSTPLFDAVARRREAPVRPTGSTGSAVTPVSTATSAPVPVSPSPAPVGRTARPIVVPGALVAAIEAIPAQVAARPDGVHLVPAEQLALVEAVSDAITRAVVDAIAVELDRIVRERIVRD